MPELERNRPDPAKVAKAIAEARARDDGTERVVKVLYLDDKGETVGEWASTQLPENPWAGITVAALQEPPFRLEQLVFLAEMHPIHSAALEQKTADVCGQGWEWDAEDPDTADEKLRDEMEDWFSSLAPDEFDMREVIESSWLDVETTGWGLLEGARDPQGIIKRVYPVPAHTVKAHRNGFALCQVRDSRKMWFRRWGAVDDAGKRVDVDSKTGSITAVRNPANDLFVIKKPSRRSTWYGIPGYISAIGWITLALAARDDNLWFFANRREPRWAIILTNLGDDPDLAEDIKRAFTVDLRQPHRNIIIPVAKTDAKVEFTSLSGKQVSDGTYLQLGERADKQIMVAHRVPAERLANSTVGALGGNVASEANRVYKEGVVAPAQEILTSRLNRFIAVEFAKSRGKEVVPGDKPQWLLRMKDLDIRSSREDLDQAVTAFHADMVTLREARDKAGLGPLMVPAPPPDPVLDPVTGLSLPPEEQPQPEEVLDAAGNPVKPDEIESPLNDKLFTELPGVPAGAAGPPGGRAQGVPPITSDVEKSRLTGLEFEVQDLLRSARETHHRLSELADE